MLQLWSAGLAVAAALLCYAFVAGETVTLFVCGAVFAAAVWTGPGGSRVRSPLSRVVNPTAHRWKPWLAVTFVAARARHRARAGSPSRAAPRGRPGTTVRSADRPPDSRSQIVAGWNS